MFWNMLSSALFVFLLVMITRDRIKAEKAERARAVENQERLERQEARRELSTITDEAERRATMKQIVSEAVAAQLEIHEEKIRRIVWEEITAQRPVQH